jgi:hypothetical protein
LFPGRGVRASLMIWGCITYEGVGTLTVDDGNINAQKYTEVIDNFAWPVIAVISQMTILIQFTPCQPFSDIVVANSDAFCLQHTCDILCQTSFFEQFDQIQVEPYTH